MNGRTKDEIRHLRERDDAWAVGVGADPGGPGEEQAVTTTVPFATVHVHYPRDWLERCPDCSVFRDSPVVINFDPPRMSTLPEVCATCCGSGWVRR